MGVSCSDQQQQGAQEQGAQERGAQEQGAQEQGAQEQGTQEQGAQEQGAQEQRIDTELCIFMSLHLSNPQLLRSGSLINGEWGAEGEQFVVSSPLDGWTVATVVNATEEDVSRAVDAAHEAFQSFRFTTGKERSEMLLHWRDRLLENKEDIAVIIHVENGKTMVEARAEVDYCASFCLFFSHEALTLGGNLIPSEKPQRYIQARREPVGVCALICPWNFPAAMFMRKAAAAIGAGCTMVARPSSRAPLSSLACAWLAQAGIPNGVVNVVASTRHELAHFLCTSPKVQKVSLTGSTGVGTKLAEMCASTLKRVTMELGGNAPFIVCASADLDLAAKAAVTARFRVAGQTCVCPDRFLVHESRQAQFVEKVAELMKQIKIRNGADATMGPMFSVESAQRVYDWIEDAREQGATVVLGGTPPSGTFLAPALLTGVPTYTKLWKFEIFGPVIAVCSWSDVDEVIKEANDCDVGLAGYVFGEEGEACHIAERLEVGMVGVNCADISEVALPFGGVKMTGYGREGSIFGLDDYTTIKSFSVAKTVATTNLSNK